MIETEDTGVSTEAEAPEAVGSTAVKRPPRKRAAKPDALIAESVERALEALREEFPDEEIGAHAGVSTDDERVMTHRFEGCKRGYRGWQWYATLARAPRAKNVTVCELGLLPSEDSVLAPPWVPWSERIRPEDTAEDTPDASEDPGEGLSHSGDAEQDRGAEAHDSAEDPAEEADQTEDRDQNEGPGQAEDSAEHSSPRSRRRSQRSRRDERLDEQDEDSGENSDQNLDDDEPEPTAAEIEASVAVKRRPRRRRYRTRSTT